MKEILYVIVIEYGPQFNYLLALTLIGILTFVVDRRKKVIWSVVLGAAICLCLALQITHCFAKAGMEAEHIIGEQSTETDKPARTVRAGEMENGQAAGA